MDTGAARPQSAMPRRLDQGEIHIWHARLEQLAGESQDLVLTLSPDERDRADRFKFEKDRDRFAMSRGILRKLLGEYLNAAPEKLQIHYGIHGKPYLADNSLTDPILFNVSHSCGLVLFGFSRGQEIGVDLERIRTDFDFESIARRFLSPGEFTKLFSLMPPARAAEFFRLWTRMEAYAKAQGIGISLLDSPGTTSQGGENSSLRTVCNPGEELSGWKIEEFTPEPDFVASVASMFPTFSLKHWKYSSAPRPCDFRQARSSIDEVQ
jgi:4'-phosphopantetheinyl transferase